MSEAASVSNRRLDQLLDEYGESHRNPVNKLIHWVCVPVIVWTVVALLWVIPFPFAAEGLPVPLNWATVVLVLAQVYYFRLSLKLGTALLLYNVFMIQLTVLVEQTAAWPLWQVAVALFVIAWIGQFIGHVIEGKRPSFFKDVQFLLIGPAWLMAHLFRMMGLCLLSQHLARATPPYLESDSPRRHAHCRTNCPARWFAKTGWAR